MEFQTSAIFCLCAHGVICMNLVQKKLEKCPAETHSIQEEFFLYEDRYATFDGKVLRISEVVNIIGNECSYIIEEVDIEEATNTKKTEINEQNIKTSEQKSNTTKKSYNGVIRKNLLKKKK